MQIHVRMVGQEVLHELGLMGRKVIENDVDLLFGLASGDDFGEKGNEICAGMTSGRRTGRKCS